MPATRTFVRAVNYLDGVPVEDIDAGARTFRNIGAMMGRLNHALSSYYHPGARTNDHPWDTSNCLRFQPLARHIADAASRKLVDGVFDHFRDNVKARLDATRHQIIHQDGHGGNVLVDPDNPERVAGIIDFGDMVFGPIIADLAVATDTGGDNHDRLGIICETAAGFDSTFALTEDEVDLLFDVVCARNALVASVIASRNAINTDEPVHLESYEFSVAALDQLLTVGRERATREIRRACRFPVYCPSSPDEAMGGTDENELLAKRHRFMGEKTTHFLQAPDAFRAREWSLPAQHRRASLSRPV